MNNVSLTGINQRVEVKTTSQSGKTWVTGTIRVRNKMKNNEGKYDSSFFDYKVLGARADTFAKYHGTEGGPLNITGDLVQEKWESNGDKRSKVVIMVQDFDLPPFDDSKPAANNQSRPAPASGFGADPFSNNGRNDVPFDLSESELPF